jgi:MarR family transcriptional regulator, transcriptional regulator for hemolysin
MAEAWSCVLKEGLLQRQPYPEDRRSVVYSLIPVAMEKTGAMVRIVKTVNGMAIAALMEGERAEFMRLLSKISETMKAALSH